LDYGRGEKIFNAVRMLCAFAAKLGSHSVWVANL